MRGEYSLADIAAATGNGNNGNNAFDNPLWALIFLAFLGNNNGLGGLLGGGGNGNGGQVPFLYNKLDGITYGISDATFSLNNTMTNGFANVQSTLCQGFSGVNNAITVNGYETRNAINDLGYNSQKCCCEQLRAIDGVNYNMAQNTCAITNNATMNTRDIIEAVNANYRALHDELVANRIEDKNAQIQAQQNEINTLRLKASQEAQNNYLTATMNANVAEIIRRTGNDCPIPAYVVNGPTPINFPTNCCGQVQFSNNCGCGNY